MSLLSPEVLLMQKYLVNPIDIYELRVEEIAVLRNDIVVTHRREFKTQGALGQARIAASKPL
eukprot:5425280-Pyramimonas_sp.AAC.1